MSAQTAFLIFAAVVVPAILLARGRGPGRKVDAALAEAVNAALRREFPFGTVQIDVKAFGGEVILGGHVREFAEATRAVELARAVPGVASVDNRIAIHSGR